MPISYSVDHEKRVIFETWTGEIDATELASYWQRYLADPDVLSIRRTLVDLRHCRIRFTGAQLSHLVQGIVEPSLHGKDWKTAIVADSPVEYGVSRQYGVYAERYSTDSVFSDPDAALAWLLS
jgi:hypothetical protein